jgi:hypothetical protein
MLLLPTDLEHLGQMALQDFGRETAQASAKNAVEIEKHAQRLEAKLEQLYAVAATMAQRQERLEEVAALWSQMVSICDRMASALSAAHPGAPDRSDSYDRILDIRNACEENRSLHA